MTDKKDERPDEQYARLKDGRGWAYAVLVEGQGVQRYQDPRSLDVLLDLVSKIDAEPRARLRFIGASDGDEDAPSTGAGDVLVSKIVGLRYWSPRDDAARDSAFDAASVIMASVGEILGSARDAIDDMRGELEPGTHEDEKAEKGRKVLKL